MESAELKRIAEDYTKLKIEKKEPMQSLKLELVDATNKIENVLDIKQKLEKLGRKI